MKKPMIGLIPLVDEERESYWMLPGYMEGVRMAGGIPVMLPLTTDKDSLLQMADVFDGFLYTGGHDVSPTLYGEKKLPECGKNCNLRDEMEQELLNMILERDKPVLGICRGIQMINVCLGGSLYQDLPTQFKTETEHHQKPPYDIPIHEVTIVRDSPLYQLFNQEKIAVNSYHHQAVKQLSEKLKAMAYSEDGLTEAVYMPEKTFVWAVQWHPEFSYKTNPYSQAILRRFVESIRKTQV